MCGICGEVRFDGTSPDLATLKRMLQVLRPRGPDAEGYYGEGAMMFGQRRLAVIDLSERSHQPMLNQSHNYVLVFNGTIYNYRTLRHELIEKGHIFQSDGDTEVILAAYAEWGLDCVTHLEGMFAFALWDVLQQRLLLARDRMGIKPLYFVKTENYVRFASTLPALLAAGGVDTSFDKVALHHHFTLHAVVPAPRTIFNGVRKVRPATYQLFTIQGDMQTHTYWHLSARRPALPRSEGEWFEAIKYQLQQSVNSHRTVADVPVGILLSGGLDSSLLVALLAQQCDSKDLVTFSVGFEDAAEEKGSEFEYSDLVVARYPTRHHRYTIPNTQVLQRLPEAVRAMSEPMVGQDAVAFYLLAEQVAKNIKVVQSGQGADEVFAGYFWYPQMAAATGSVLERFCPFYFDRPHSEFAEMLTPEFQTIDYTSEIIEDLLTQPDADTFIDQVLRMDVTTLIVDDPVKRVDNMTMAYGLEARVPFLDHSLVELAAAMPPELKLRDNGKYILKAIARDILPAGVIDRPKGYFPMPALKYVRGDFLSYMRDLLLSPTCLQRGLYQRAYVEKLLAAPEQYLTAIKGSKLWHLALLEQWLQIHGV